MKTLGEIIGFAAALTGIVTFLGISVFPPVAVTELLGKLGLAAPAPESPRQTDHGVLQGSIPQSLEQTCTLEALRQTTDGGYIEFLDNKARCLQAELKQ